MLMEYVNGPIKENDAVATLYKFYHKTVARRPNFKLLNSKYFIAP